MIHRWTALLLLAHLPSAAAAQWPEITGDQESNAIVRTRPRGEDRPPAGRPGGIAFLGRNSQEAATREPAALNDFVAPYRFPAPLGPRIDVEGGELAVRPEGLAELAGDDGLWPPGFDGLEIWGHWASAECQGGVGRARAIAGQCLADVWCDYHQFYRCQSITLLGGGLSLATVLANTTADEHFQQWHDAQVRGPTSDQVADVFEPLGRGQWVLPGLAAAAIVGYGFGEQFPAADIIGQWGSRSLRAVAVGGLPLLLLSPVLGASRPSDGAGSYWHPFEDNNSISGHAFIGAVPLLTAARMTDCTPCRIGLVGLSTMTAWSRINDRKHYLSQAILGWWLAWLATDAVARTEANRFACQFLPEVSDGGLSLRAVCRY